MTISICSKRGIFELKLVIDEIPEDAQKSLEVAYGPFIDKINTLIKFSIENQDFDMIQAIEETIRNIAKEKLSNI